MRLLATLGVLGLATTGLIGCGAQEAPQGSPDALDDSAIEQTPEPPYHPIATVQVLMRSTVSLAAADYWASVSIVVDADGVHENFPADEEEWSRVFASAITLAESGNLLMMPTRALDQGDWMRLSRDLVDVGLEAARAADAEDYEAVLDVGEKVYNVCTECHEQYVPALRI